MATDCLLTPEVDGYLSQDRPWFLCLDSLFCILEREMMPPSEGRLRNYNNCMQRSIQEPGVQYRLSECCIKWTLTGV